MAAARQDDRPLCHVCLEGDDDAEGSARSQLVHGGCGCRGSAGFVHHGCLVDAAMHNPKSWTMCPTCLQEYTGPACLGLARARDEQGSTRETKIFLANGLSDVGQFAEARRLYEQVAAAQSALFGPAHPETLGTKCNLAILLDEMGEWAESRVLHEQVLASFTVQLGPAHTSTLKTKGNLANLLHDMGELAEARRLFEQVVMGWTAQLGPAHTLTLATKNNLALLLQDMGERAEARWLLEEVVAGQTVQLGPAHTETLATKNNLATLLKQMLDEAAVVVLKGLVGAPHLNGKRASVLNFAADRGRFVLRLEADGKELNVKPANVEVAAVPIGLAVDVGGLVGTAQHNGKRGKVVSGPDPSSGRYNVRLDGGANGGRPLGLLPANLRLLGPEGLEPEPEQEERS